MRNVKINKKILLIIAALALLALVLWFVFPRQVAPTILSTNPAADTQDVSEKTNIDIVFDKTLKEGSKTNITLDVSPQASFSTTWLGNQLTAVFKKPLDNATTYTASVKYSGKEIYNFSFTTALFSQEQMQKEGPQQALDDKAFSDAFAKFIDTSPWYLSLPIEKTDYAIVYDFNKKQFRIRFSTIPSDDQQKNTLVQAALNDLKSIGVKEPIQYYTLNP